MDQTEDRQSRYWESIGRRRDAGHPVVAAFAAGILRELAPYLQAGPVLDVGCGNGFLTLPLSRRGRAVGVDFAAEMLARNPVRTRVQGRAEALPFPDRSFPVVLCQGLLHHCPDPGAVVREMARVSSRYVIAHEPNRNNPAMAAFSLSKRVEWGALRFGATYLASLFEAAGLQLVENRVRGMILPNKTPEWLLGTARQLDEGRALPRMMGFYRWVVGEQ